MEFIQNSVAEFPNVEVDFFEGLTVDYCFEKNAQYIIRGLRNPADFEFEKQLLIPTEHWHTKTGNGISTDFFRKIIYQQ